MGKMMRGQDEGCKVRFKALVVCAEGRMWLRMGDVIESFDFY